MADCALRARVLTPRPSRPSPAVFGKLPNPALEAVSTNPIAAQYEVRARRAALTPLALSLRRARALLRQLPPAVLAQLFVSMAIAEGLRARFIYGADNVPGARPRPAAQQQMWGEGGARRVCARAVAGRDGW